VFPQYAWMRYAEIPVTGITCSAIQGQDPFVDATAAVTDSNVICQTLAAKLRIQVGFPIFMITVMNFLGWILLMVFVPLGMWALPFDSFFTFVNRPKPMTEVDFNKKKQGLAKDVQTLLAMGKKLVEDKKALSELNEGRFLALSKWRAKRNLASEQHLFETNCMLAE
jgi:hypothetical protein